MRTERRPLPVPRYPCRERERWQVGLRRDELSGAARRRTPLRPSARNTSCTWLSIRTSMGSSAVAARRWCAPREESRCSGP